MCVCVRVQAEFVKEKFEDNGEIDKEEKLLKGRGCELKGKRQARRRVTGSVRSAALQRQRR